MKKSYVHASTIKLKITKNSDFFVKTVRNRFFNRSQGFQKLVFTPINLIQQKETFSSIAQLLPFDKN